MLKCHTEMLSAKYFILFQCATYVCTIHPDHKALRCALTWYELERFIFNFLQVYDRNPPAPPPKKKINKNKMVDKNVRFCRCPQITLNASGTKTHLEPSRYMQSQCWLTGSEKYFSMISTAASYTLCCLCSCRFSSFSIPSHSSIIRQTVSSWSSCLAACNNNNR